MTRTERAIEEGKSYQFFRADAVTIYVHNPKSCGTYTVTKQADGAICCDCPDMTRTGLRCKHIEAAGIYKSRIQPLPPRPEPKPKFDAARFETIFGAAK